MNTYEIVDVSGSGTKKITEDERVVMEQEVEKQQKEVESKIEPLRNLINDYKKAFDKIVGDNNFGQAQMPVQQFLVNEVRRMQTELDNLIKLNGRLRDHLNALHNCQFW
jgi:hypothetical protein